MRKLITLLFVLLAMFVVAKDMVYCNGDGFFYHPSNIPIMFVFGDGTGFKFDFKGETLYDIFKTLNYSHSYSKGLFDCIHISTINSHKVVYYSRNFKFNLDGRCLFYINIDSNDFYYLSD